MKTQNQYQPHNADDLGEGWDAVAEYAEDALLAAFDGCHKIYLAMDEEQAEWFRNNYNGVHCDDRTVEADAEDLATVVREWYDESCGLRFVNAVFTNVANPNDGYVSLISQWANESDDDDDDDDDWGDECDEFFANSLEKLTARWKEIDDEIASRLDDKDEATMEMFYDEIASRLDDEDEVC